VVSTATDRRLGLNSGAAIKVPCQAVAVSAIVLSGEQTIGGIAVHAVGAGGNPDRVLVTGGSITNPGSNSIDNGIWAVSTGQWTRDLDFDGLWDVLSGGLIPVWNANGYSQYVLTTPNPVSIGSTGLTFLPQSLAPFVPAGTGAVSTTVTAGINARLPSVFDFMTTAQIADVQGRTRLLDVTVPLQSALNTARLYFMPEGDYLTTAALTKTSNWGGLVGAGMGTRIITSHLTADVFTIGDGISAYSGMTFRDFRIWSTVTKTGGYAFNCQMLARSFFENVHVGSLDDYTADGNVYRLFSGYYFDRFDHIDIIGGDVIYSNTGIKCRGNADQSFGDELNLTGGLNISGGSSTGTVAVRVGGASGGVYLDRVSIGACAGYGLYVDDALQPGINNREIILGSSCVIDSCANWGVYLASDAVSLLEADGAWIASCGNASTGTGGLAQQPTSGVVPELKLTGLLVYNNYGAGLALNQCSLLLSGSIVRNNGTAGGGADGVSMAAVNVTPATITGNWIHDNGNGTAGYGLNIASGSTVGFVIEANNFTGNGKGAINDPAANSTSAIVRNNTGYVTENSGVGTVLLGNTTLVVNHGLAGMPTRVMVWFAGPQDAGTFVYTAPSSFTSTQFTITLSAAAGAGRDIGWRAVIGFQ